MISFDNTENAFKSKSNSDLSRSYWLFKMVSNPLLVNFGAKVAPLGLNIGFKGLIKNTIFYRPYLVDSGSSGLKIYFNYSKMICKKFHEY